MHVSQRRDGSRCQSCQIDSEIPESEHIAKRVLHPPDHPFGEDVWVEDLTVSWPNVCRRNCDPRASVACCHGPLLVVFTRLACDQTAKAVSSRDCARFNRSDGDWMKRKESSS